MTDTVTDPDAGRLGRGTAELLLGASVFVAIAFVVVGSRSGVGLSPDSITYIQFARHLSQSGPTYLFNAQSLTIFPPGFSMILAVLFKAGLSVNVAGAAINAAAISALVIATYLLSKQLSHSREAGVVAASFVAVASPIVSVHVMLWSEPLFCAVSLLDIWVAARAADEEKLSPWTLAGLVALTGIAFSLRYIGLFLVPVVFVGAALAIGRRRTLERLALAGVVAAASLVVPVVLVLRNRHLGARALGDHPAGGESLNLIVDQVFRTLGDVIVPPIAWSMSSPIGWTVLAVCVASTVLAGIKRVRSALVVASSIWLFWIALTYSEASTRIDAIDPRLISPVIAPTVVLLSWLCFLAFRSIPRLKEPRSARRVATSTLVGVVVVAGLLMLRGSIEVVRSPGQYLGYNTAVVKDSSLSRAVGRLPSSDGVATQDPYGMYWGSGHSDLYLLPATSSSCDSNCVAVAVAGLKGLVSQGEVSYLAYGPDLPGASPVSIEQLQRSGVKVREVELLPDGALYALNVNS